MLKYHIERQQEPRNMTAFNTLRVGVIHTNALEEPMSVSELLSYLSRAYPWASTERKKTFFIVINAPVAVGFVPFSQ